MEIDRKEYDRLVSEGYTRNEIASKLFMSLTTLRRWMKEEGLIQDNKRGKLLNQKERYVELRDSGKSNNEIIEILGVSNSTLYKYIGLWGIGSYGENSAYPRVRGKCGNYRLTADDVREIRKSNMSSKELSEHYNVEYTTIRKIIKGIT